MKRPTVDIEYLKNKYCDYEDNSSLSESIESVISYVEYLENIIDKWTWEKINDME